MWCTIILYSLVQVPYNCFELDGYGAVQWRHPKFTCIYSIAPFFFLPLYIPQYITLIVYVHSPHLGEVVTATTQVEDVVHDS